MCNKNNICIKRQKTEEIFLKIRKKFQKLNIYAQEIESLVVAKGTVVYENYPYQRSMISLLNYKFSFHLELHKQ